MGGYIATAPIDMCRFVSKKSATVPAVTPAIEVTGRFDRFATGLRSERFEADRVRGSVAMESRIDSISMDISFRNVSRHAGEDDRFCNRSPKCLNKEYR